MPARRSFRSSRRVFRRRFAATRKVSAPGKLQACNFFFNTDLNNLFPGVDFSILELATTGHLQVQGSSSFDIGMENAIKGLELGGIVYNADVLVNVADTTGDTGSWWIDLYWDSLLTNRQVFPVTTIPNYNPATVVAATQGPVAVPPTHADMEYPMRWIHRDFGQLFTSANFDSAGAHARPIRVNKRLKRRLDDRSGLYLACCARGDGTSSNNANIRFQISGTLYYRWLFQ